MENSLSDLVDIKKIDGLYNSFYQNFKLNIALTDSNSTILTHSISNELLSEFLSENSSVAVHCDECCKIFETSHIFSSPPHYFCSNNRHMLQLPVTFKQTIIGYVIVGPFKLNGADENNTITPDKQTVEHIPTFSQNDAQSTFQFLEQILAFIEDYIDTKIERKTTERSLALEQNLMRTLMTNIPDAIYFKDLQSRFIEVSTAKALKHGFKNPAQIVGKTDFDLYSKEHAQPAYESEQEILQTGNSKINIEEMEIWKDKKSTWVSTTKMPLRDKDGYTIGTFGISRDISKRKEAELEVKRINNELKELNATKDKFFSIIAHDLKSPFTALLGISELLTDPTVNPADAENKQMLQHLQDLIKKEYELLQNLLDWSCLQLGRMEYQPTGINLFRITSTVLSLLSNNASAKNIAFYNTIEESVFVSADANMVKSIIQNFVSNAIKFTNSGGKVVLASKPNGTFVDISVEDNGIGISDENLKKLFRLDVNFTTPGTNGEKGTGLGTVLCKEMVEKHGGTVTLKSTPGIGTDVHFTLPLLQ